MAVQFRILGPLDVVANGKQVELGGTKQRALLANLLIHSNQVLSIDRLIEDLWEEEAPKTAANVVQVHVSALRKAFAAAGAGREVLLTRPPGYLVRAGPRDLDVLAFEELASQGRSLLGADSEAAVSKLGDALDLWRGSPLQEFAFESFAQAEISRLDELRVSIIEDRIGAELDLGHHARLVGELHRLVGEHPLRDRLREHLMLALYRSGRQAEALQAYRQARETLADELGIDPSPSLQRLERAVLEQDPSLERPGGLAPAVSAAQAPPPTVPAGEMRKVVTVLYVDAEPTTSEGGRLDPEIQRAVLGAYVETMHTVVKRHEGTVHPFAGNALLAVFGVPITHEDDPLRAIRVVVDTRKALAELNERLAGERNYRVVVRMGLMSGDVLAGGDALADGILAGDAVSIAARLAQAAAQGEVLLGEPTYRLVRDVVQVEALPLIEGSTLGSAAAYRLVNVRERPATPVRLDSPMVGRDRELRLLEHELRLALSEGTCRLVTVVGAPGIGKSRLSVDFLMNVGAQVTVARGVCLSYGEGITYWALAEVIRGAANILDTDPPALALAKIESKLTSAPDGSEAAAIIAALIGLGTRAIAAADVPWAVRLFLEAVAAERPLVLIFDDIHWGEPDFLDLLEYLTDIIRQAPVFILCLGRPELAEHRPDWAAHKPNATAVTLNALDEERSVVLVHNLLGAVQLPTVLTDRIQSVADGNPLFVQELLTMLIEAGLLWLDSDGAWVGSDDIEFAHIPPTVQLLLSARLDRLTPDERGALQRASVEGQLFHSGAVSHLSSGHAREDLPRTLFSLVRKDLTRPDHAQFAGEVAFSFKHILIRDAAYETLLRSDRSELHEQFAGWLTERAGVRLPEYEEIVGYHLEQAYLSGVGLGQVSDHDRDLARRASSVLSAVAHRALGRDLARDARGLFRRSLALLPDGDPGGLQLQYDLAFAEINAGDWESCATTTEKVLRDARAANDQRIEALAMVLRATIEAQRDPDVTLQESLASARESLQRLTELGDEHDALRASTLVMFLEFTLGRADQALVVARKHLAWALRLGDQSELRIVLARLMTTAFLGSTPVTEVLQLIEDLRPLAHTPGVRGTIEQSRPALLAMLGRFGEARMSATRVREAFTETGGGLGLALTAMYLPLVDRLSGDLDAAERQLRECIQVLEDMHEHSWLSTILGELGRTLYEQGRYREAESAVSAARSSASEDDFASQADWRAITAKVRARQGAFEEAERLAREAVFISEPTDYLDLRATWLMDLAEVLTLGGRPQEARGPLGRALDLYERKGNLVMASRARELLATAAAPGAARARGRPLS
jgi:DNA-binding SARP family transcriptional activator